MNKLCRLLGMTGLSLALLGPIGCQTYIPGMSMTLPSGRYLEHPPQYIPPDPDFPLQNELTSMERTNAAANAAINPGVRVPTGGAGVAPGRLPGQ